MRSAASFWSLISPSSSWASMLGGCAVRQDKSAVKEEPYIDVSQLSVLDIQNIRVCRIRAHSFDTLPFIATNGLRSHRPLGGRVASWRFNHSWALYCQLRPSAIGGLVCHSLLGFVQRISPTV